LTIEGVKSFRERSVVPFAPITVLTGTNSSGKSSLLQVFLALKQTFEMPSARFAGVSLNGKQVTLGAYEDMSSGHQCGPVKIALKLAQSPHTSAWEGLSTSIRPWWAPEWNKQWTALSKQQMESTLELHLERSESTATWASVKRFRWISSYVVRGDRRDVYDLVMTKEPPAEEEIPPPPTLPDDPPSPTAFQFRIDLRREVAERSLDDLRSQSRGRQDSARATLSGLSPAVVLTKTKEQAVYLTMATLLSDCVGLIVENMGDIPGQSSKYNPKTHVPEQRAIKSKLRKTILFLEKCGLRDFLLFLGSYGHFALDVIAALKELIPSGSYVPRPGLRAEIAQLCLSRLQTLIDHLGSVEKRLADDALPPALVGALGLLGEQLPPMAPLIALVRRILGYQFEPAALDRLCQMVLRAATELSRKAVLLTPVPARSWLESDIYWYRKERDYPTEAELKGYFTEYLYHLGPLRDEPKNLYASDLPVSMADVGKRGERAIACLRAFGTESVLSPSPASTGFQLKTATLGEAVIAWGRFLGVYDQIEVKAETKYGTVCKVATDRAGEAVRADLTNVGVGVSQVLPVLVLCLAMPVGSTVLIEQPELHLHPAVQSRLAEFFAACALTGRQIVVETHSEHLVNGLRLLASEGRLVPERDVALSFIERDDFGSQVTPVAIGRDGSIDRWPAHFFDEAEHVLSKIMRNKMAKE
jgi:predicted ATPase